VDSPGNQFELFYSKAKAHSSDIRQEQSEPGQRHLYKMKSRTRFFTVIVVLFLVLGISWFTCKTRNKDPMQVFPATINRDCAPWDGSAFTISIPHEPGTIINISIWQSPDIKHPAGFSFQGITMRNGNASYLLRYGYSIQLTGNVFFRRVERGNPVEGDFNLITETGQRLKGRFIAEWEDEVVTCG